MALPQFPQNRALDGVTVLGCSTEAGRMTSTGVGLPETSSWHCGQTFAKLPIDSMWQQAEYPRNANFEFAATLCGSRVAASLLLAFFYISLIRLLTHQNLHVSHVMLLFAAH